MPSLTARRTTTLALIVLLGLGLTGCGDKGSTAGAEPKASGQTSTSSSPATQAAAPSETPSTSAPTAVESAAPTVPAPTLNAQTMPMRLAAALARAKSLHFEIPKAAFGGMQVSSKGEATLSKDNPKAVVSINMMGPWKMIYVDGQTYVKPPMQAPNSKTWMLLPDNEMGMGLSGPLSFLNPTQLLVSLQNPGAFKRIGPAVVDGVQTMQYQITMDSAAMKNWLKMPKQMQRFMPKKAIVNVWMDANDLPRQVSQRLPVEGQSLDLTMKLSNFGTPVNAVAPPKDQIGNFGMGMPSMPR
ncbi:MAG: hypothetical protein R2693_02565 [Nocardioidaceae bacterium]|jgi:hypothetical protein|nr:hypothetical protein [Nocardioidaceae bacterium]